MHNSPSWSRGAAVPTVLVRTLRDRGRRQILRTVGGQQSHGASQRVLPCNRNRNLYGLCAHIRDSFADLLAGDEGEGCGAYLSGPYSKLTNGVDGVELQFG